MLVPRLLFLMIFRSESGCLELEDQAFGMRGIAKIVFHRNWISHDSRVMILGGLRTNFHDFCCPGDWLEICRFFKVILESSQILSPSHVEGNAMLFGVIF